MKNSANQCVIKAPSPYLRISMKAVENIDEKKHIAILGVRKIGKTLTAKILKQQLPEATLLNYNDSKNIKKFIKKLKESKTIIIDDLYQILETNPDHAQEILNIIAEKKAIILTTPYRYEKLEEQYNILKNLIKEKEQKILLEVKSIEEAEEIIDYTYNYMKQNYNIQIDKNKIKQALKDKRVKIKYTYYQEKRETIIPDTAYKIKELPILMLEELERKLNQKTTYQKLSDFLTKIAGLAGEITTLATYTALSLGLIIPVNIVGIPIALVNTIAIAISLIAERKKELPKILSQLIELKALENLPPAYLEEIDKKLGLKPGTTETTIKTLIQINKNPQIIQQTLKTIQKDLQKIIQQTQETINKTIEIIEKLEQIHEEIHETKKLLLHYDIVETPQQLRQIIQENSLIELPEDEYLLPTDTPELQQIVLEIVEKSRKHPVIIIAPPGTGKTVLLYQIGKTLLQKGHKIGYLNPTKPLTKYHIEEDRIILYDNITDKEILKKIAQNPTYMKQTILTIRDYIYKILKEQLKNEIIDIEDKLQKYTYLLNLDKTLTVKIIEKILQEKNIKIEQKQILDRLAEKIKVKYTIRNKTYETYTLLSVSLLPKILEGNKLTEEDLEKIPNTLQALLAKIIRQTLRQNFIQQITIMKTLAYIGGTTQPIILTLIEKETYKLFQELGINHNQSYRRQYRRLLTRINNHYTFPHDSWIILLSPTLEALRERGYPKEKETKDFQDKIAEELERLIIEDKFKELIKQEIKTEKLKRILERGIVEAVWNPHGQNILFKILANIILSRIIKEQEIDIIQSLVKQIDKYKPEQIDTILHYLNQKQNLDLKTTPYVAYRLTVKYSNRTALNVLVEACASGVWEAAWALGDIARERSDLLKGFVVFLFLGFLDGVRVFGEVLELMGVL